MKREKVFIMTKKIATVVFAVVMMLTGIVLMPEGAEATVNTKSEVIYLDGYDLTNYWTTKKAPIQEGYVFGGWYSAKNEDSYLTEDMIDTNSDGIVDYEGEVYAKFVPAQVLSVKAQNQAGTGTDDTMTKTYVRILTSLDSKNYQKVGFDIWLSKDKTQLKKADGSALETTNMYDGLLVGTEKVHATTLFGANSKYVGVWQLTNIAKANWGKIIYVRPYWITMDGTKVEGLAKYVHIEDQYAGAEGNGLVSVPVNLLTGEEVAVGVMKITYPKGITFHGFESGKLLTNMTYKIDETGTENNVIYMTGIAPNKNSNVGMDGIFANVRFEKPNVDTEFDIEKISFSTWSEKIIDTVRVWDVKYEVITTE